MQELLLNKLAGPQLHWEIDSGTGVFLCNFIKKVTLAHVIYFEFCQDFRNTFFVEQLCWTTICCFIFVWYYPDCFSYKMHSCKNFESLLASIWQCNWIFSLILNKNARVKLIKACKLLRQFNVHHVLTEQFCNIHLKIFLDKDFFSFVNITSEDES